MSTKDTNPKDAIGSDKVPLHLWPSTATAVGSIALLNGALKYGRSNWRVAGVRSSIYYDAATRHLNAWFEGEEKDPDDGVDHLGAVLACVAILVDARAAEMLNDDRATPGGYRKAIDFCTSEVPRLKELHKGKAPVHYTLTPSIGEQLKAKLQETIAKKSDSVGWYTHVEPGMPCKGTDKVKAVLRDGYISSEQQARFFNWSIYNVDTDIVMWRYV